MAFNVKLANATVNGQADQLARYLDNGFLRIYDGAQAASADTALGAQVLLAELRFNATSAPAAAAGVLTFNAFTADSSANADGTATWYRALRSDGTTVVMDGSAGDDSGTFDLELNDPDIQAGTEVSVVSFTHTVPKS
jgi:hypothetical protein